MDKQTGKVPFIFTSDFVKKWHNLPEQQLDTMAIVQYFQSENWRFNVTGNLIEK